MPAPGPAVYHPSGLNKGATVSMPAPYPLQMELHADVHITR
jgi:hypothetical protein